MLHLLSYHCLSSLTIHTHLAACAVFDLVHTDASGWESGPSIRDRCDIVRRRTFQREGSVVTPICYRSQLFPPLSPESPAFLLDILKPSEDANETNVHFTVYNMSHRCDVNSRWLHRLQTLLSAQDCDERSSREKALMSTNKSQVSNVEPSLIKVSRLFFIAMIPSAPSVIHSYCFLL